MIYMSDNPVLDEERYMRAMEARIAKYPVCHCCGEHIQDDEALHYSCSEFELWLCQECIWQNTELIEVD